MELSKSEWESVVCIVSVVIVSSLSGDLDGVVRVCSLLSRVVSITLSSDLEEFLGSKTVTSTGREVNRTLSGTISADSIEGRPVFTLLVVVE